MGMSASFHSLCIAGLLNIHGRLQPTGQCPLLQVGVGGFPHFASFPSQSGSRLQAGLPDVLEKAGLKGVSIYLGKQSRMNEK